MTDAVRAAHAAWLAEHKGRGGADLDALVALVAAAAEADERTAAVAFLKSGRVVLAFAAADAIEAGGHRVRL